MSRKTKIFIGVAIAVLAVGGTVTYVGYKQGLFTKKTPAK